MSRSLDRAGDSSLSVLVLTVVHHPLDARIWHRQIRALLDRGWSVTYAAPFSSYGIDPPTGEEGLRCLDVPRAVARRRLAAQRGARSVLRRVGPGHDVVLLHDPELILSSLGLDLPPAVWDVHEDTAAALEVRAWLPSPLRRPAAALVRQLERWAERRLVLLLADRQYADRFARSHPVVPNTTRVVADPVPAGTPDADGRHRVVYLGSITMERGAREMVNVGRRVQELTDGGVRLEVLGPAHGRAVEVMRSAHEAGDLLWHGFVTNDEALARVDGALAGLSLLQDVANFRPSMPTKLVEYLSRGVPVITTPLPVATDLVRRSGGGVVVPFGGVDETVDQLLAWHSDPDAAVAAGRQGHRLVAAEYDWKVQAGDFVDVLETVATAPDADGK